MKAELKRLHSPDVLELVSYHPTEPFGILVQMMIGPMGEQGEEAFDIFVCSPDWTEKTITSSNLIDKHTMVMETFSYEAFYKLINDFCQSQTADSWSNLVAKISRIGKWEFADYQESLT